MNISYKWLKKYIDVKENAQEVADRLTSLGLEVDAVEEIQTIKDNYFREYLQKIFDGEEEGYRIAVVDNSNKSEAKYWIEDFLNIKPCQDNYFQTRNFMTVCKNFLSKQLPEEFEVSKADQVELLNKSVQYFKENEEFSIQDFSTNVLE